MQSPSLNGWAFYCCERGESDRWTRSALSCGACFRLKNGSSYRCIALYRANPRRGQNLCSNIYRESQSNLRASSDDGSYMRYQAMLKKRLCPSGRGQRQQGGNLKRYLRQKQLNLWLVSVRIGQLIHPHIAVDDTEGRGVFVH